MHQRRGQGDVLQCQNVANIAQRPVAFPVLVDMRQRLEGNRGLIVAGFVITSPHCHGGSPRRTVLVEHDDLRFRVLEPLQRQQVQQGGFAGAGRAQDDGMANVPQVEIEAERGGAGGATHDVRVALPCHLGQVPVFHVPGPDGGNRHHVRQVDGVDQRAAHIGGNLTRQAALPGFKRIQAFILDDEAVGVEYLLHLMQLVHGLLQVFVPDRDGGGVLAIGHQIETQLLRGGIRIIGLVLRIGVEQAAGFTGSGFLEHHPDAFDLSRPVTAFLEYLAVGFTLVQADEAVHPAVFDIEVVEPVENARNGGLRETGYRKCGQVMVADHGDFTRLERLVRQPGIQVHRQVGSLDRMHLGGNGRVQVRQQLVIIQFTHTGENGIQNGDDFSGGTLEVFQVPRKVVIESGVFGLFVEQVLQFLAQRCGPFPDKGQVVGRLVMFRDCFKVAFALLIHQPGNRFRPAGFRVGILRKTLGLHEVGPAGAEAFQGIVDPCRDHHHLLIRGGSQVRAPEGDGTHQGAVLVEDNPGCNQRSPRQVAGKAVRIGFPLFVHPFSDSDEQAEGQQQEEAKQDGYQQSVTVE